MKNMDNKEFDKIAKEFEDLFSKVRKAIDKAMQQTEQDIRDFDAEVTKEGSSVRKQLAFSEYANGKLNREELVSRINEIDNELAPPTWRARIKSFLKHLIDGILPG